MRHDEGIREGARSVDPLLETRTPQTVLCAVKYAVTFGVNCSNVCLRV